MVPLRLWQVDRVQELVDKILKSDLALIPRAERTVAVDLKQSAMQAHKEVDVHGGKATADDFLDAFGF